ncbi:MAG TPA: hypothetical protein VIK01_27360 [Polyangiaceae bacterium]
MTRNVSGTSLTTFEPRTDGVFAWFSQRGAILRREQRDLPRHRYSACSSVSNEGHSRASNAAQALTGVGRRRLGRDAS